MVSPVQRSCILPIDHQSAASSLRPPSHEQVSLHITQPHDHNAHLIDGKALPGASIDEYFFDPVLRKPVVRDCFSGFLMLLIVLFEVAVVVPMPVPVMMIMVVV